jgi:hypothetical protein
MKKSTIIQITLILICSISNAQISGQTAEKIGAVPGIEIGINDSLKTTSDIDGFFSFFHPDERTIIFFRGYPTMPKIIIRDFPIKDKMILQVDIPLLKSFKGDLEKIPISDLVVTYSHIGVAEYYYKNKLEKSHFIIKVDGRDYKIDDKKFILRNGNLLINWKDVE